MALFPIQGIFDGDFVVLLVPIDDQDPMTIVAEKVAHHVVGKRIPAQEGPLVVCHEGVPLEPGDTVVTAGVQPMDVLRVSYA